jgi:gamma-glutamylaminecyclotransferase
MSHMVFVYGTFKKGFPNHDGNMDGARLVGKFKTLDKYPLVINGERGSPCILNEPGKGYQVQGELYEVDDEGLARMDALEGINRPDGYRRHTISVVSLSKNKAEQKEAEIYLKDPEWVRKPQTDCLKVYGQKAAKKYIKGPG